MSVEIGLLVGLLLLLANAFFVGAEFSLVSVRRSAIEGMVSDGSKRALITLRALENVSVLMAGAQLGITLCSLGLGAVAEPALAQLFEGPFHALHVPDELLHPIGFALALIITVFLHVVIGEMVPKNIALASPEKSALILTPSLVRLVRILKPIVYGLNAIASGILYIFGVRATAEVSSTYTRDEMADLVKESRKEGYLSEDNEHLLSGALTFDSQTVNKVAIPFNQVVTIGPNATYESIEALSAKTGFSRFPVVAKKGEIKGYVHIKDIIQSDQTARTKMISKTDIRQLVEVSSNQSIRMTLKLMQRSGAHMALAMDGKNIYGLITLEDVIEELVGELNADKLNA